MKNGTINNSYLDAIISILSQNSTNRPNIAQQLAQYNIAIPRTTLIRILSELVEQGIINKKGSGRATTYSLPDFNPLLTPETPRDITRDYSFNPEIFQYLNGLFTDSELASISRGQNLDNPKELERFTIDFSWKSSAIEGNTYSHFDTLNLLTRGHRAKDKTTAESQMILNHQTAVNYIFKSPPKQNILTLDYLIKVHSLLINNLDVRSGIRRTQVGVSGTTYLPPKPSKLSELLDHTLHIINTTKNPVEQAFACLFMLSYLQPFEDGNKRTARLISSSILVSNNIIPPSYFDIDERDFLMATLLFYEQNTTLPLKKIFLKSIAYAASHYFL